MDAFEKWLTKEIKKDAKIKDEELSIAFWTCDRLALQKYRLFKRGEKI